jgi:hypothetical protein
MIKDLEKQHEDYLLNDFLNTEANDDIGIYDILKAKKLPKPAKVNME